MKTEYLPSDRDGMLFHLIEECGEVIWAVGKAGRFGMGSRHPDGGRCNAGLILQELADLRRAIDAIEPDLSTFEIFANKRESERRSGP